MKSILLLAAAVVFTLPCCTTYTTTHPDGSVTVTREPHMPSLTLGAGVLNSAIDRTGSK